MGYHVDVALALPATEMQRLEREIVEAGFYPSIDEFRELWLRRTVGGDVWVYGTEDLKRYGDEPDVRFVREFLKTVPHQLAVVGSELDDVVEENTLDRVFFEVVESDDPCKWNEISFL